MINLLKVKYLKKNVNNGEIKTLFIMELYNVFHFS